MVIYADILFFVNLITDYFLLLASAKIVHLKFKRLRLLLSALFGAAYSLIMLVGLNQWLLFITKIFACVIMILIAFSVKGVKSFFKVVFAFLVVNFVFGGCVTALYLLTGTNSIYSDFSGVYFNISPVMLIAFVVVSYVVIVALNKLIKFRNRNKSSYRVQIRLGDRVYSLTAFVDSGNMLIEPFSGYPVAFFKKGSIPECEQPEIKRPVVCKSVGGSRICYAFRPQNLEIIGESEHIVTNRVYICENENILENSGFDMILNPGIFENEECVTDET